MTTRRCRTTIDIGGQDNKVIKLDASSQRSSFKMNRKCAAGTGAFLEEMAMRLDTPLEQMDQLAAEAQGMIKLGSIGFESLGTDFVKILDPAGNPALPMQWENSFHGTPCCSTRITNCPKKTEAAFRNGWFSAGDMAMQDDEGFYQIMDRKDNMIITGREHVYPSEVEEVIASHECVTG